MQLELTELEKYAQSLGFGTERVSRDQLDVSLHKDTVLTFKNLPDDNDNAFGFLTTPWHAHDKLDCSLGKGEWLEFEPDLVLLGLKTGDLIIVSRYLNDDLQDVSLAHIGGLHELELAVPNGEIRIRRIG